MPNNDLVIAASADVHMWAGVNPYVVGGVVISLFFFALYVLVAFGNGREHS